jgi:hypothetical protein
MVLRLCHRKLTVTRRLCSCARAFTPACEREHRRRCVVVPECSGVAQCWLTTGCSCMRVRSTFPSMASLVTSSRILPGSRTKKELTRVRAWMRCHVPARGASSVTCRNARTFLRAPSPCAVAAAILDWGLAERATNFSHVFQPLGSIGVRHGCTGQLHNQLFTFGADGKPEYKFKAEQLLRGETDGSSYPNGGLRSKLIGFGAWALRLQ